MTEQEQFPAVRVGSWAMVVLPGEIDMAGAPGLGAELDGALAQGVSVLVVDMTATTFCDSAAVRELVTAHRQAEAAGAQLRLAVPPGTVRRVLDLLELDRVLRVYPSLDEAMADAPGSGASGAPDGGASPSEAPGTGRVAG